MLAQLHATLTVLESVVPAICEAAAAPVEAQARVDMTTPRGNVPMFKGAPKWSADVPISARASGNVITVSAVDWAHRKAIAQGKAIVWIGVVDRVAGEMMREAIR